MADSLTEIVVERFYRFSGYLVERDVPLVGITGPQNWSDLDVLAVKDNVIMVNCKDFVPDPGQKERIYKNFDLAEECIRRNYASVIGNKTVERIFVYGGCDRATLDFLSCKNIQCKSLGEMLARYLGALEGLMEQLHASAKYAVPKGKRWYRTGNLRGYDKMLQYLLNNHFLALENGKIRTWQSSE